MSALYADFFSLTQKYQRFFKALFLQWCSALSSFINFLEFSQQVTLKPWIHFQGFLSASEDWSSVKLLCFLAVLSFHGNDVPVTEAEEKQPQQRNIMSAINGSATQAHEICLQHDFLCRTLRENSFESTCSFFWYRTSVSVLLFMPQLM